MPATTAPFDLSQLQEATEKAPPPSEPVSVKGTDGVSLAVREYLPPAGTKAKAVLVFYHGGGAHSGAGYQLLAQKLASDYSILVYTPDLRGHGQSGGARGDAPSPAQVHHDVDSVLDFVMKKKENAGLPLFLGGHSSGGGLMIQYATQHTPASASSNHKIQGYLLVSPQLGPNAGVAFDGDASSFAKVSILPFIMNGIFGVMGHNRAVQFQYTQQEIDESGVVPFNTVNMANAISPTEPAKQLQEMADRYPMKLWMGQRDELFDAEKVKALYTATEIVSEATHLGILVDAHKFVGPWMGEQLKS